MIEWVAVFAAAGAFLVASIVIGSLYWGVFQRGRDKAFYAAHPEAKPPSADRKGTTYGLGFLWVVLAGLAVALAYDAIVDLPPASSWLKGAELGSFFFLGQLFPYLTMRLYVRTYVFQWGNDLVTWLLTWVIGGAFAGYAYEAAL